MDQQEHVDSIFNCLKIQNWSRSFWIPIVDFTIFRKNNQDTVYLLRIAHINTWTTEILDLHKGTLCSQIVLITEYYGHRQNYKNLIIESHSKRYMKVRQHKFFTRGNLKKHLEFLQQLHIKFQLDTSTYSYDETNIIYTCSWF